MTRAEQPAPPGARATPRSRRSSTAGTAIRSPCSACTAGRRRRRSSVRVFGPGAEPCDVVDAATGKQVAALEQHPPRRLLRRRGRRPEASPSPTGSTSQAGDASWEAEDPYRFPPILGELDVYLLAEGTPPAPLRAARRASDRRSRASTASPSPSGRRTRRRVSVVGDFNDWDGRRHPMRKRHRGRRLGAVHPRRRRGERYKFEIARRRRRAAAAEGRPGRPSAASSRRRPPRSCTGCRSTTGSDARLDGGARGPAGARRADLDLRGASRLVAARATATAFLDLRRARPTQLIPYVEGDGLHPYRAAAGHRASRSTAPGATSRSASSRRPAASARRRSSPRFVDRCHAGRASA